MSTPDPTKTLAFVVHEVRLLLAGHLGSGAHGDPPVRAAAHLAYALHNQALAVMKDGSFDGETAEAAIARVDEMLGESFSRRLSEAIRATGSSGHASEHTMLNRMADSSDLGGAVVFLLGDASRYITGTLVDVSGGR